MKFYFQLMESAAIAISFTLLSAFATVASPAAELSTESQNQLSAIDDAAIILSDATQEATGDAASRGLLSQPQAFSDLQKSEDAAMSAVDNRGEAIVVNRYPAFHNADHPITLENSGDVSQNRAADLQLADNPDLTISVEQDNPLSEATSTEQLVGISSNALDPKADLKASSFTPIEEIQSIAQAPTLTEEEAAAQAQAQAQAQAILGVVLSQLNHSPYVFGTPSTVVGSFGERTQLTGDWGGARSRLPEHGVFFDVYATTAAQGIVSGARNDDDDTFAVIQNIDAYLNIVNPWPGAILHVAFQSKLGDALSNAGTLSPTYYGSAFPVVNPGDYALLSEYYLMQAFAPNFQLILGKVNATNFADANVFANNYRYQFQNASLNNNLMMGSYAPPSMWMGAIAWQPEPWLNIVTSVGDPGSSAENFADDFFNEVLVSQEFDFAYRIHQNPGNFRLGWLYSSQNSTDFSDPFNTFGRNGFIDFRDPIRTQNGAYMVYANFDQYLFTVNTADGKPDPRFTTPRGLGLFGRFGIGPEDSNFINSFFSLGMGAKGVIPGREYDEFGLGWYYLDFANGTIDAINDAPLLSRVIGQKLEGQETGFEAYYNLALTPALQMAFTAQYIIDPLLNNSSDDVFILGGRLQLSF